MIFKTYKMFILCITLRTLNSFNFSNSFDFLWVLKICWFKSDFKTNSQLQIKHFYFFVISTPHSLSSVPSGTSEILFPSISSSITRTSSLIRLFFPSKFSLTILSFLYSHCELFQYGRLMLDYFQIPPYNMHTRMAFFFHVQILDV